MNIPQAGTPGNVSTNLVFFISYWIEFAGRK